MTDPGERSFPPLRGYGQQPSQGYGAPQGYGPPQQDAWQPPGYGYQAMPPPGPPRRKRRGLTVFLAIVGAVVVLGVAGALAGSHGTGTKAGSGGSPAVVSSGTAATSPSAPAPPVRQTITYVVTGASANVTYGPTGTSRAGKVPMHVTRTLRNPVFYSITAQLNGSGTVRCKILVDHKVISASTASGGYNIASCEISRDPLSGKWANTNSG
jgi:hypothetical protein